MSEAALVTGTPETRPGRGRGGVRLGLPVTEQGDTGPEFEPLRLAARYHARFIDVFTRAVTEFRTANTLAEIEGLLERYGTGAANNLDWAVYESYLGMLQDVLRDAFQHGGRMAQARLPARRESVTEQIRARFDIENPRAAEWLRQEGGRLIVEITAGTREAIIAVIARGAELGWTRRRISQELRKMIGLTSRQAQAALRFDDAIGVLDDDTLAAMNQQTQELLQRGGIRKNQLNRIRRDGLRAGEVAKLSAAYRKRLLRYRAMTIARTEAITSLSAGQHEAWTQAMGQGLLDPVDTMRQWNVTRDERLDTVICAPMAGQRVPFNEPFLTGDGRRIMHPSAHPNCRCTVTLYDPLSEIGRTR